VTDHSESFRMATNDANDKKLDWPLKEFRTGGIIAGVFFLGLLGWAALTPLDAGATAQGVVAVSGSRQAVQHRDGGVVTQLSVVEGQLVRQGDVLLKISASELVAEERGLTGETLALIAERTRLIAERDGLRTVAEPAEFAGLPAEDQALAEDALRGQRLLFEARRHAITTEQQVINQRIRQHSEQIGGHRHQLQSNREQQRLIGEELTGLRTLLPSGYVSVNRIRAMERSAAELDGQHGALTADVARTSAAISEARLQGVSLYRAQMEDVATQLRATQLRLAEVQPKLLSTRERLGRSVVRAPASGRVVGLKVFTVGGVASAGATLMEIVPQDRALVVSARASPTDADDLKIGMSTQVRFSALQERNLPIVHGAISKVSADSFEDERTGGRYFEIEVIVPPEELDRIRAVRADLGLRPGLPAEVMVPLRKRSALEYLLEPLTQTVWRAGREN
jgi:HlyD family type I secretion membrane fusion protein